MIKNLVDILHQKGNHHQVVHILAIVEKFQLPSLVKNSKEISHQILWDISVPDLGSDTDSSQDEIPTSQLDDLNPVLRPNNSSANYPIYIVIGI